VPSRRTHQRFSHCRRGPTLSHRYITDRFLPDKAIDLIDEARCLFFRCESRSISLPTDIDQLERKAMQLEIEKQALKKEDERETPGASRGHRKGTRRNPREVQHAEGQLEKRERFIARVSRPQRADRENSKWKSRPKSAKANLQRVAEIRYSLDSPAEEQLSKLSKQMESQGGKRMLKEEVDEEDVARIVSK